MLKYQELHLLIYQMQTRNVCGKKVLMLQLLCCNLMVSQTATKKQKKLVLLFIVFCCLFVMCATGTCEPMYRLPLYISVTTFTSSTQIKRQKHIICNVSKTHLKRITLFAYFIHDDAHEVVLKYAGTWYIYPYPIMYCYNHHI